MWLKRTYKVFRTIAMVTIALAVFLPAALFVVLSSDWAAERIKQIAETELGRTLGTEVSIGHVHVMPFDFVEVSDVVIKDDNGKPCLLVSQAEGRIELLATLFSGRIQIDYGVIDGVEASLYKETKDSPLNINDIIERLKKRPDGKPPTRFDVTVSTVKLRNTSVSYDILSEPVTEGRFNPNHIHIKGLDVLAHAPRISNDEVSADIEHLSFDMVDGLYRSGGVTDRLPKITNLAAKVHYTPTELNVENLALDFPSTHLILGDYDFTYQSATELTLLGRSIPLTITLGEGSYVTPSDFAGFLPQLSKLSERFDLDFSATVSDKRFIVNDLKLYEAERGEKALSLLLTGKVEQPFSGPAGMTVDNMSIALRTSGNRINELISIFSPKMPESITARIGELGDISLDADLSGTMSAAEATLNLITALGQIDGSVEVKQDKSPVAPDVNQYALTTDISIKDLQVGRLAYRDEIGSVSAKIEGNALVTGNKLTECDLIVTDSHFDAAGYAVKDFDAALMLDSEGYFDGYVSAEVLDATMFAHAKGQINGATSFAEGAVSLSRFSPERFGLTDKFAGYELGGNVDFNLRGSHGDLLNLRGFVELTDVSFRSKNPENPGIDINRVYVSAEDTGGRTEVTLESDIINGTMYGDINFTGLVRDTRTILAEVMPIIGAPKTAATEVVNNFGFDFTIDNVEAVEEYFPLPVAVLYPITLSGSIDTPNKFMTVSLDAPYLMKGDKLIEQTSLEMLLNGREDKGNVLITTKFPTPKGDLSLAAGITASGNQLLTNIDWGIERAKPLNGVIAFNTTLTRDNPGHRLGAKIDFVPGEINFGRDTWTISPSTVLFYPGYLEINDFELATDTQTIRASGVCSAENPDQRVTLELDNLVLNAIFETLDINKALIGGQATGTLLAGGLFQKMPFVTSEHLVVKNVAYNGCVLGDGVVRAMWDNDEGKFNIDVDVYGKQNNYSHIVADIFPASQSMDIYLDADRVDVGFMKPYMAAFADGVTGTASGKARVFGTFNDVNMEGDIFVDNLGVKIGFTNTWYYATDSIHIRPGRIALNNVQIRDSEGHTAKLNGVLTHDFFRDPAFDFRVTEARDFLSFDCGRRSDRYYYGKIYGNGSAFIQGAPGKVGIDIDMSTAEGTTFTYLLSDEEEALQFNFIQFRDKNAAVEVPDTIIQADYLPPQVAAYRDRILKRNNVVDIESVYNINIQMDITPAAKVIIVMDPVAGDEIKSWGHGNLRMTYTTVGEELKMYGTYTLDRGDYDFTMQDIIVKDFKISEGSSITFSGDPNKATLDIKATYSVNANLTDLDKSFSEDHELNRTNVPVHAVLLVKGDMHHPDLAFDLEFPTLSSDIYRKVRSIVSTEEMMNQQIIYLLALNRFYAPEYMATTSGNELFSVASSTLSSRLSNMLGKISENWTISPNLRSDRGDFTDVQFDVALSSNLLNNRLRFNGNFGYRDKSLNTTQFIGDVDVEYLVNSSGTWRLKAYNRFNDQTYFLRTAKTTQGLGVMFQRDFDDFKGIFRSRKKSEDEEGEENDE